MKVMVRMVEETPLILVVDDDWMNRELLEAQLRFANYRVVLAHSGQQALQLVTQEMPDLVLLDVRLQDMTGMEVCAHIRQHPATQHIPVLMLTALETAEVRRQSEEAGANGLVAKPLGSTVLLQYIAELLTG